MFFTDGQKVREVGEIPGLDAVELSGLLSRSPAARVLPRPDAGVGPETDLPASFALCAPADRPR